MSIKIKNRFSGEEHVCDVLTSNGHQYYVNGDTAKNGDKLYLLSDSLLGKTGDIITVVSTKYSRTDIIKADGKPHWFASNTEYQKDWSWRKVFASNNPDDDLPKIVDNIEYLADTDSSKVEWDFESSCGNGFDDHVNGFKNGFNESIGKYSNSDVDMIAFSKWLRENDTEENAEMFFGYTDLDMLNYWKSLQPKEYILLENL